MGLQFRKRTKGKDSWLNFSHSKKNGFSASLSVKVAKGVTMNFGGKGNRRATVNFGNGVRYVKYREPKAKPKKEVSTRTRANNRTYNYTPVEPPKPVTEVLGMCQKAIIDISPKCGVTHYGDLQVFVDLHNAIDFMIEDPNSLENIDLMTVTTNQFLELANRIGNEEFIENANIIRNYVRSVLPSRPKPPPPPVKEEKHYGWWIAGVVTVLILLKSCT